MVLDRHTVTTDHKQNVMYGLLNCAVTNDLDQSSRSFHQFLFESKCSLLLGSLVESPGNLMKDDTVTDLE